MLRIMIIQCQFINNIAKFHGGVLYIRKSVNYIREFTLFLYNSFFVNNTAKGYK